MTLFGECKWFRREVEEREAEEDDDDDDREEETFGYMYTQAEHRANVEEKPRCFVP